MSGEFGSYDGGYFHTQIDRCADDAREGEYKITRLWGDFLTEFRPVREALKAIEQYPRQLLERHHDRFGDARVGRLRPRDRLRYVAPYQRVADAAVRAHIRQEA